MADGDAIRDCIKKGEERLSHSKSTLARLKSAEARAVSILLGKRASRNVKGDGLR
jgi:hypothetical protein